MTRKLDVYIEERLVGILSQEQNGELSFQYDSSYVDQDNNHSISVSMPLSLSPYESNVSKAFFSGLLPDDIIRKRLANYLGISETNSFTLLEAVGGECAGALSLYPEGEKPTKQQAGDITKLDAKELKEILDLLKKRPLMVGVNDIRLSLAGAQDKLAVGLIDGKIALVTGATPTTHILKPAIDRVEGSVQNEVFCMRLAKSLGFDVPNVEIRWLNDIPYFLIERYDRIMDNSGNIIRLHQEDFCQAF